MISNGFLAPDRLAELLAAMAQARTLVVGDVMLDAYILGRAERVSPEAPVMVVRAERDAHVPGGAANVARCVRALGAGAGVVGVIGEDAPAGRLVGLLLDDGCDPVDLIADAERTTTVKTRVLAGGQQVVRVDREDTTPLASATVERLVAAVERALPFCTGVLLSDYEKGVLSAPVIDRLLVAARAAGARVAVNAKPRQARCYGGVELLTINRAEAAAIGGEPVDSTAHAAEIARRLRPELCCDNLLITLGPEGAVICSATGAAELIPAWPVQVFDVAGAGDTTIAAAHLALLAGASPCEATALAMRAAAVVVRKTGVATASAAEILKLCEG